MSRSNATPVLAIFSLLACLTLSTPGLSAQETSAADEVTTKPPSASETIGNPDSGSDATDLEESGVETLLPYTIEEPEPPEPRILISLADQQIWVFEGHAILQNFPVSTGVPGHRTPTGNYRVWSKAPRAYSSRYECWMLQWMAITADGLYGMHSLQGTSYLSRIGSVASHGCIRLTHDDADWLYEWAEIGIPVEIVSDWDEPVEETTEEIDTGSDSVMPNFHYW